MRDNILSPLSSSPRIPWIDGLRGLAIVAMIFGNFAPYLATPHPLWLRLVGSCAAPAFIMLSSGMVILRASSHSLNYYVMRGALIVGMAALVDILVWSLFPFASFDVLNLIGLAIPLAYLARHRTFIQLLCIGSVFFVATPVLQTLCGYDPDVLEISLFNPHWPGLGPILKSWFIDGWFPIFPWLGYAFVGGAFIRSVFAEPKQSLAKGSLLFGIPATVLGSFLLFVPGDFVANVANDGILEERNGYSELFYPPTLSYIIWSLGAVVLMAWIAWKICQFAMSHVLQVLGQYPLFIYILHQFMGKYLLLPLIRYFGHDAISSQGVFLVTVLIEIGFAYLCCKIIENIKVRHPPKVLVLQILFGR